MTTIFPINNSKPTPNPPHYKHQWDTTQVRSEPILTTVSDHLLQSTTQIPTLGESIALELGQNQYFINLRNKSSASMDRMLVKDPNMSLYLNLNHQAATTPNRPQQSTTLHLQPTKGSGNGPHIIQTTQQHIDNEQTRRLYVGGFDSTFLSETVLREIFKSFGPIETIIFSPNKHQDAYSAGVTPTTAYAFVQYEQVQSVYDALSCMSEYKIGLSAPRNFKIALPTNIRVESFFDLKGHAILPEIKQKWDLAVEVGFKYNLFSQITFDLLKQCHQPQQQTYKVYVGGGFANTFGENDLHAVFSQFGRVAKISLIKNPDGSHKGYGFIDFYDQDAAIRAKQLDGQEIGGKKLLVSDSRRDNSQGGIDDPSGGPVELFEYDLNNLIIPDPLRHKYPHLPDLRPSVVPSQNVRIANLYSYDDWKTKSRVQQEQLKHELENDFAAFGVITNTKMTTEPMDVNAASATPDKSLVCFYVQFSSIIEARRCILTVNNRTFEGRPVTATYTLKL